MSITMNLDNEILASGAIYIEDDPIITHVVPLRHSEIQKGLENNEFRWIDRHEFYGIVRSHAVGQILLTYTEPLHLVIDFGTIWGERMLEYYKIDKASYFSVTNKQRKNKIKKSNWLKEGF